MEDFEVNRFRSRSHLMPDGPVTNDVSNFLWSGASEHFIQQDDQPEFETKRFMASDLVKVKQMKSGTNVESDSDGKSHRPPLIEREGQSSISGSPATKMTSRMDGTHDRARKIGHRRVNEAGMVTYKKKTTTELMSAIQLGIGQSITSLSGRPKRDLLLQDFSIVETVLFPKEGSGLTPSHNYSDFRFKTYAPVAFRYFRELFGIQPDDFLLSLSNYPLQELSNPGASGSIFYITEDDEFIIKTVSNKEADFLQKLLPGYYMNLNQNPRTLLPKFYGLFCYQCGGKNIRFVVMNNLLPMSIMMHEKYDLKGSTYKRKASRQERSKKCPTLKDLDFIALHVEGLMLEADTFGALVKTIERDCRVLQSFQIMDYSLLMSVHNLDQAIRDRDAAKESEVESPTGQSAGAVSEMQAASGPNRPVTRGRSIHQRLAQFSTTMEAIHAKSEPLEIDEEEILVGGIPARNFRGERLLLYIGIIDILQSYRITKKLEHAMKALLHDGDTISVHRPGFYAQRFQNFFSNTVFKKIPSLDQPQVKGAHVRFKKLVQIALKHSPSHRKSLTGSSKLSSSVSNEDGKQHEKEPGGMGGRPDVLPSATPPPTASMAELNLVASDKSDNIPVKTVSETSDLSYLSSPAHTAVSTTASTPTHTSFTEGTPSYTASSPSCSTGRTPSHASEHSMSHSADVSTECVVPEMATGSSTEVNSLSREVTNAISELASKITEEELTSLSAQGTL